MSKLFNWLKRSESMSDRCIKYIKYKNIKMNNFYDHCRIGRGTIRRVGNKDFPEAVIKKICDACPDLNPQWLRTGKGQMILSNVPAFAIMPRESYPKYAHERQGKCIDRIKEYAEYKKINLSAVSHKSGFVPSVFCLSKLNNKYNDVTDKTVNKVLAAYPDINPDWMWFGKGQMIIMEEADRCIDRLTQYMMMNNLTDEDIKSQCGLSPEYLPHVRQGMYDLSPEMIHKICDKYPTLNPVWVRTGEGQMLIQKVESRYNKLLEYIKHEGLSIDQVQKDCDISKSIIDKMPIDDISNVTAVKILKRYKNLSPNWFYRGIGNMIIEPKHPINNTVAIPLFSDYVNGKFVRNTTHGGFPIKKFENCIGGIQMPNNSMEPSISRGTIMFFREHKNMDYIDWGMIYIIIVPIDTIVIGKIYPLDNSHIICRRVNKEKFPDIIIDKKDICKLYQVKGIYNNDKTNKS